MNLLRWSDACCGNCGKGSAQNSFHWFEVWKIPSKTCCSLCVLWIMRSCMHFFFFLLFFRICSYHQKNWSSYKSNHRHFLRCKNMVYTHICIHTNLEDLLFDPNRENEVPRLQGHTPFSYFCLCEQLNINSENNRTRMTNATWSSHRQLAALTARCTPKYLHLQLYLRPGVFRLGSHKKKKKNQEKKKYKNNKM